LSKKEKRKKWQQLLIIDVIDSKFQIIRAGTVFHDIPALGW
jgi:hypothetical protein